MAQAIFTSNSDEIQGIKLIVAGLARLQGFEGLAAMSIDENNGGAANYAAVTGISNTDAAQAQYDRMTAFLAAWEQSATYDNAYPGLQILRNYIFGAYQG